MANPNGYWSAEQGRWVNAKSITVKSSGALAATTTGSPLFVGDRGTARLTLAVTAASGTTPTLDCKIQTSSDNDTWRDVASFAQATGVTSERKSFVGLDKYIRLVSTLGGTTPNFTCSVDGDLV